MAINTKAIEQWRVEPITIVRDIEEELLQNVAKTLSPHIDKLKEIDNPQEEVDKVLLVRNEMLADEEAVKRSNLDVILDHSSDLRESTESGLKEHSLKHVEETDKVYSLASKSGVQTFNVDVPIVSEDVRVITTIEEASQELLDYVNTSLNTMYSSANALYVDASVGITEAMISGKTIEQGVRQALSLTTGTKISGLVDKAGKTWTPTAYYEMLLRTSLVQSSVNAQFSRQETRGNTLIEVSSKADARPKCADDQGKIYDRRGDRAGEQTHEGEPILDFSNTSFGEPDGLFGINCGHEPYDYIDGYSEKTFKEYDKETTDANYDAKVQSRYNERQIRNYKTDAAIYDQLGLNEARDNANELVAKWQEVQRDHVKETGIPRQYSREQIR